MRIPGFALRSRVVFIATGENTGDGETLQAAKPVKCQLATKTVSVDDVNGKTLTQWSVIRVRPTTRIGSPRRTPAVGDLARVGVVTRKVISVEPVNGPGTAVAYLEITVADSTGSRTVTGNS